MKARKRKINIIIVVAVMICLLFTFFSIWANKNTFTYSNLMDDESKSKAQLLLSEQNIPQENIDLWLNLIDEFYHTPYPNIVEHGWEKAFIPFFSYDDTDAFAHLDSQPESLINCRTTAFILMKDSIVFGKTDLAPAKSIDLKSTNRLNAEDTEHYNLLFANIDTPAESSEEMAEIISEYWRTADIQFTDGNAQLIMVYGASRTTIQNFHTVVAVYCDDCIWMLEKVDPIYPYQLSCFKDQAQMIEYLKKRVTDVKYAAIFSNDTCLWKKKVSTVLHQNFL